jgi:AraC family transcriptional regulator, positive regulator of tynA and feaB
MMSREWSTVALPAPDQFPFWSEVVREAFVPVNVTRRDDGPFLSRVRGGRIGSVGVSHLDSPAQTVRRTPAHVAGASGDVFFLNLPLSPGTCARQDGRVAGLAPGDFAIVDSSRPFELEFQDHFKQISLTLPHDLLAPRLAAAEQATAVRVDGSTGVGAVASASLRAFAMTQSELDSGATRELVTHLSGLVALAIGSVTPYLPRSARSLLADAARDEIDRSLSDPHLSRTLVAERLAISTRHLDRLFADQGTSFGRWLLSRRLECSHQALTGEADRSLPISQIARAVGFSDPSYFTRAFKARYGRTPMQVRSQISPS